MLLDSIIINIIYLGKETLRKKMQIREELVILVVGYLWLDRATSKGM